MFEPVHGSAPDIAGKNIANPIGQIWSGAMMVAPSRLPGAAEAIERAIAASLVEGGPRTRDLGGNGDTKTVGAAIAELVKAGQRPRERFRKVQPLRAFSSPASVSD